MREYLKTDTLIVGGGMSGLSLGSHPSLKGSLIVAKYPLGGLIHNTLADGFSFDFGGHVYTTTDDNVTKLMTEANAQFHESRKAFYDCRLMIPYPVQDNAGKLGLAITPDKREVTNNLYDYFLREFGFAFTQYFLRPFNERVWSTPIEQMDFDWVDGRVKRPSESKSNWGMNSSFYYARGSAIADVMLGRVLANNSSIVEGTMVSVSEKEHTVTFVDGENNPAEVEYNRMFCTSPYFLPTLKRNSVVSIGIGLKHKLDFPEFDWLYCNVRSFVHRVTLLSRYAEGLAPEGCDSLLLEIPTFYFNQLNDAVIGITYQLGTPESRLSKAKNILIGAGFSPKLVEAMDISTVWGDITPGYPVPTVGSRDEVAKMKSFLSPNDIYLTGRWGAHGYFNLQHIFADADATVKYASGLGNDDDYLNSSFYYKKGK